MNPLKIATDKSILPQDAELHWLLTPLFEPSLATEDSNRRYRRIYRDYYKTSSDLFELVSLEEADVVVIPADWSSYQGSYSWLAQPDRAAIYRAQKYADLARQLAKPVVVFFSGERSHERVPLPGAWIFRKSMYRSQQRDRNVIIPPVFYLDLLEQLEIEQPQIRVWEPTPTVGFCGLAREKKLGDYFRELGYQSFHYVRERTFGVSQFRGIELRCEALRILSDADEINTKFIMRKESVFFDTKSEKRKQLVRQQFLENMLVTDYQLSVRGSACVFWRS